MNVLPHGSSEIYIFIGPPGSGKGSLASLCLERSGWDMLSTGNLCRRHMAEETEIGKEVAFAIKSGKLVSDELISKMVEDWFFTVALKKPAIIMDGYPRTVKQAEVFDNLLKNYRERVRLRVVRLSISDEKVIERLSCRFICSNKECQSVYSFLAGSTCAPRSKDACDKCEAILVRREDDEAGSVRKRLLVYRQHAEGLLDFYSKAGYSIIDIDVERPLSLIFDDFVKRMGIISV